MVWVENLIRIQMNDSWMFAISFMFHSRLIPYKNLFNKYIYRIYILI
jgi:hypothetical protein